MIRIPFYRKNRVQEPLRSFVQGVQFHQQGVDEKGDVVHDQQKQGIFRVPVRNLLDPRVVGLNDDFAGFPGFCELPMLDGNVVVFKGSGVVVVLR